MKKLTSSIIGLVACLFIVLFLSANQTFAQSFYDDYSYAYNSSDEELASIAADRLFERGYTTKKTAQAVDMNKKGYVIILQSSYTNAEGEKVTVQSAATGCKDMEEATKIALEKLRKDNPALKYNEKYVVVAKYENR
jgi:hypothetical protein